MLYKTKEYIRNLFNPGEEEQNNTLGLQQKANTVFGVSNNESNNPFLKSKDRLFNSLHNYQSMLDGQNISSAFKNYIQQSTGITSTSPLLGDIRNPQRRITVPRKTMNRQIPITTETSDNNIKLSETPNNNPQPQKTSNSIAEAAKKYLGTPYVWGGESMEEGGMDCSGFVYNALKDAGHKVGRTTAQGYRSGGTVVSKSEMQAGDLIFFGSKDNATHIGIYLGDGQMIHSSGGSKNTKSNPGKGVSITNVDNRKDFIEARRY